MFGLCIQSSFIFYGLVLFFIIAWGCNGGLECYIESHKILLAFRISKYLNVALRRIS